MLPEIITRVPGPVSQRLGERLRRFESPNVTFVSDAFPVFWERAEGVNVWDADGNRFLDLTSAFGVAGLGHGREEISAAMREQSRALIHAMGDVHPAETKVELCARLSELTFEGWNLGTGKSILANSGFEAVEAALKTALVKTGKPRVITFEGAYHGLGYGTLAAGCLPYFRAPFRSQLGEFGVSIPFPEITPGGEHALGPAGNAPPPSSVTRAIDAVRAALTGGDVGAVLVEPVQGRGGTVVAHPAFLAALRELCTEFDALLIFDEIYTGLNRTGKLFACDHYEVYPDIICLGKALASGYPLSACVAKADIMNAWPPSEGEAIHTSTFLGNPVGCAMALASLRLHGDPATAATVSAAGATFRDLLKQLVSPHTVRCRRAGKEVARVRGLGLMLGLEIIDDSGRPNPSLAGAMMTQALRDGLILLACSPDGNVLSLTPPFGIAASEMTWARDRFQEYLTSLPGSIS